MARFLTLKKKARILDLYIKPPHFKILTVLKNVNICLQARWGEIPIAGRVHLGLTAGLKLGRGFSFAHLGVYVWTLLRGRRGLAVVNPVSYSSLAK